MNLKYSISILFVALATFICQPLLAQQSEADLEQSSQSSQKNESTKSKNKQAKKPTPKYASQTFVYKKMGDRELKLYVTKPDDWQASDDRPAVVFFHGGGWVGGQPGQFDEHSKYLAARGMVAVQVEYRLLPKPAKSTRKQKAKATSKTNENGDAKSRTESAEASQSKQPQKSNNDDSDATPTRCIADAKSAMRWVRSHAAELGIDPERIASGGGSAGGHLAAFLGTTDGVDDPNDDLSVSARANAMLLFNPVYNNGPDGWGASRVGERFQEFSPAHNITDDDAPAIVFLGTNDRLIPVETAEKFQADMRANGLVSKLQLFEGQPHGFFNIAKDGGKYYRETISATDKFLVDLGWLKPIADEVEK